MYVEIVEIIVRFEWFRWISIAIIGLWYSKYYINSECCIGCWNIYAFLILKDNHYILIVFLNDFVKSCFLYDFSGRNDCSVVGVYQRFDLQELYLLAWCPRIQPTSIDSMCTSTSKDFLFKWVYMLAISNISMTVLLWTGKRFSRGVGVEADRRYSACCYIKRCRFTVIHERALEVYV